MAAGREAAALSSSTSLLSTVKTSNASSTVMEPCWSMLSTEPRATARYCGPPNGVDLPGPPRARVERYQVPDVSDANPAGGIGARIAGPRLPIPIVAIYAGLRFSTGQPGGRF